MFMLTTYLSLVQWISGASNQLSPWKCVKDGKPQASFVHAGKRSDQQFINADLQFFSPLRLFCGFKCENNLIYGNQGLLVP